VPSAAENDHEQRFEVSSQQVSWDEAMGLLGTLWDAPAARAIVAVAGRPMLTMEWAALEAIDAVEDAVALRLSGVDFSVAAASCDHVTAESWEHGLCRGLVFALGDTRLSIQASWWQDH
jgi:hypothetical protein